MKRKSLVAALLFGTALGCSDATGPSTLELTLARQRWHAQDIHDYRYTLQVQCFCSYTNPMRVFVAHDTVLGATDLRTGESIPKDFVRTIDGLFDVVQRAQQAKTPLEVQYDAALGFPTNIVDNGPAMVLDGGAIYTASDVSKGIFVTVP